MKEETRQSAVFRWIAISVLGFLFLVLAAVQGSAPHLLFSRDGFSQALIRDSLERYSEVGDSDIGAFMVATEEEVHIAAVQEILGPDDERDVYPYISNYNGQYMVGRFLVDTLDISGNRSYVMLRLLSIFGMAVALSLIAGAVWRDFGGIHAICVSGTFLLSMMLLERSSSAYWFIFLSFLPVSATLMIYPYARKLGGFGLLVILIFLLVLAKSLTGYEYLTCITISCMIPIFYHEIKDKGYTGAGILRFFLRAAALGLACVAGFSLALYMHIDKMADYFGGMDKGIQAIKLIVSYSALENESGIRGGAPDITSIVESWVETFLLRNFLVNMLIVAAVFCLAAMALIGPSGKSIRKNSMEYLSSALFGATLLSVVASISWSVVMIKHGVAHAHINWVQNYLSAYIFLVVSLVQIWLPGRSGLSYEKKRGRPFARALMPA